MVFSAGLEPATVGLGNRFSVQLRYEKVAPPEGIEPSPAWFVAKRAIRYTTGAWRVVEESNPHLSA